MTRPRRLFTVMLPVLWGTICAVNFRFPGDEYGLWAVASLPGLWFPLLVEVGNPLHALLLTIAAGVAILFGLGALADRLRVPWIPWYALWVIAAGAVCATEIASYPSWSRAMSRNGAFEAYALSSLNLGLSISTLVMIAATGAYRSAVPVVVRRETRRRPD